ncbi:MAG TPA: AsmA family protein [Myxococcales bacterium]|nr:AsmA family protein [Myxococcales bacterium]
MKLLVRGVLVVVVLALVALGVAFFNLNRLIRTAVEREATSSLRLTTTLESARVGLLGGTLNLHQLRIASPQGFSAPHMLTLGDLDVAVRLAELRKSPIHISSVTIDKPALVIEQSGGALNFRKAMQLMPSHPPSTNPVKVIIDELKLQDAHVIVRPGLPGVAKEIDVPVPALTMKDIGRGKGAENGAAMKDVAMQIVAALAGKAAQSDALPPELKALLHLNVGQVMGQLGALARKQISDALPGQLGSALSDVAKEPGSIAKDPAGALKGLGGIVGGKAEQAAPSGQAGRSSKARRATPR